MWTRHKQQQQRGVQIPPGERARQGAPDEATRDREAQQHDRAHRDAGGAALEPGAYPASPIENTRGDTAPSAPEAQVAWDEVVQPERRRRPDDQPPPDGGQTPEGVAHDG